MPATGDFHLSITRALGDQLAEAIQQLTPTALAPDEVAQLEPRGGVYQLFKNDELVYIGKADASLVERVGNHLRKLSGRLNISLDEMTFTAIYVDEDLSAVAPETLLINRHRVQGALPWNFNGFGNKDPGRQRDTSAVEARHFDSQYPANLDIICEDITPGSHSVRETLALLKAELPYVFRYEGGAKRPADQPAIYQETVVQVEAGSTADDIFTSIASAMPGWQITALPGYAILYEEDRAYPSARKVYAESATPSAHLPEDVGG